VRVRLTTEEDEAQVFEIGQTLREARVRRKLTLQQAEDDTKIRVKYLQAMENEDFDVMPGVTYVKGFLRTYSTYLGLDADVIIDEYRSRTGPVAEHEPFGGVSALGKPRSHRGRNTLAFAAVVCLLVLAVLYLLSLGKHPSTSGNKTNPGAIGISSSPTPKTTPSLTHSITPVVTTNTMTLVAARGACWVDVRVGSAKGRQLFVGTLNKGASSTFTNKQALYVIVGAPASLTIKAGGGQTRRLSGVGPVTYRVSKGKVEKV
jgi:cytoskeleton protein RodZ